jgi:hypothetical protein
MWDDIGQNLAHLHALTGEAPLGLGAISPGRGASRKAHWVAIVRRSPPMTLSVVDAHRVGYGRVRIGW